MDKRGDYKYGIILSLILGLMVLSLSLYFIFNELWSGDDVDRQICRQTIQLRSLLPDFKKAGFTIDSFKDEFPLNCRTNVVEIERKDVIADEEGRMKKAEEKIAEAMAECWALYDSGDANAFPSKFFKSSTCVPCARIHLTEDAKDELGDRGINIRLALDLQMDKGYSYYNFLRDYGDKFSAFDFGNGVSFDLEGDEFGVESKGGISDYKDVEFFIGDSGNDLRITVLGLGGNKNYLAKDVDELITVHDRIKDIAEGLVGALSDSAAIYERNDVSSFCGGKKHEKECGIVEEYIKKNEEDIYELKGRDGGWVLSVDVGRDEDRVVVCEDVKLINKLSGGEFDVCMSTLDISLPNYFYAIRGDLLINYGIVTVSEGTFGDYIPYLFYFQTEQRRNPFDEVRKDFVFNFWYVVPGGLSTLYDFLKTGELEDLRNQNVGMCETWEGIPA